MLTSCDGHTFLSGLNPGSCEEKNPDGVKTAYISFIITFIFLLTFTFIVTIITYINNSENPLLLKHESH